MTTSTDLEQLRELEARASRSYANAVKLREEAVKAGKNLLTDTAAFQEVEDAYAAAEAISAQAEAFRARVGIPGGRRGLPTPTDRKDAATELTEYFTANPDAANQPTGAKEVSSLIEMALNRSVGGYRAAIDGGNLGVRTNNAAFWEDLPRRPLSVLDLIPVVGEVQGLGGEKVQYFKTTVRTNNAATWASGSKAESVLTVTREETTLWTYAHISEAVSLRLLMGSPGEVLRLFMEQDMAQSVLEAHEADILSGTGGGTRVDGVKNIAGTLTQASSGDPIRDIRKALTQLQNANILPDALVLNPTDAEKLDLETDAEGLYHMGGPLAEGEPRLWRTRVIVTTGLTAGTAILGNFSIGAARWTGISRIAWGEINTDFSANSVRLLAEAGATAAITRPGAFVKITIA